MPTTHVCSKHWSREKYSDCKRFNEQYPDIYRFLPEAERCQYNEHFPWGRFDWMQMHTMLEEDKLTNILLFRDEHDSIVGMATYDTCHDDRTYLLHTTRTFAMDGEEYCAHCGLWYSEGNTAYVEPVATVPAHRQKGLAKAAIYEACNRARRLGALRATVLSDQTFYYRISFTLSSEVYRWECKKSKILV